MDRELIKLIEDNGLTLHGDIEHFAHLVAEREREACIEILSRTEFTSLEHMPSEAALLIHARGGE